MEETRKAISTTIRVDHDQVVQIIVSDLLNKYKSLEKRNSDKELLKALEFVLLQYYLTEDEFDKFYENPELIYSQE